MGGKSGVARRDNRSGLGASNLAAFEAAEVRGSAAQLLFGGRQAEIGHDGDVHELGQELGTELGGALAGGGENRFVDRPSHPLGAGSQHGVGIGELLATGIDELDAELNHPVDLRLGDVAAGAHRDREEGRSCWVLAKVAKHEVGRGAEAIAPGRGSEVGVTEAPHEVCRDLLPGVIEAALESLVAALDVGSRQPGAIGNHLKGDRVKTALRD